MGISSLGRAGCGSGWSVPAMCRQHLFWGLGEAVAPWGSSLFGIHLSMRAKQRHRNWCKIFGVLVAPIRWGTIPSVG